MKLIIIVLLILMGAYFYPQINEGVGSACAATEQRFIRSAADSNDHGSMLGAMLLSDLSNGAIAREVVKSKYPELPVSIGCVVTYYQIMANPQIAKDAVTGRQ